MLKFSNANFFLEKVTTFCLVVIGVFGIFLSPVPKIFASVIGAYEAHADAPSCFMTSCDSAACACGCGGCDGTGCCEGGCCTGPGCC